MNAGWKKKRGGLRLEEGKDDGEEEKKRSRRDDLEHLEKKEIRRDWQSKGAGWVG